jgi:hypothetical protein
LVGRDLAGNEFQSDSTFNSDNKPFATWDIKHIIPEFAIQSGGVEISKLSLMIDETVAVQIGVLNTGDRDGEVEVTLELVNLLGSRELIKREMISVEANSLNHVVIDWRPTEPGIQWIEASIPNSDNISSEWINVAGVNEDTYLDGVMGEANPILLGMSIFLIAILTILGLMWLRMATASKGGEGDDNFSEMIDSDDYEDEYEDDDDYDED